MSTKGSGGHAALSGVGALWACSERVCVAVTFELTGAERAVLRGGVAPGAVEEGQWHAVRASLFDSITERCAHAIRRRHGPCDQRGWEVRGRRCDEHTCSDTIWYNCR